MTDTLARLAQLEQIVATLAALADALETLVRLTTEPAQHNVDPVDEISNGSLDR